MRAVKFIDLEFGEVFVLRAEHQNSRALKYKKLENDKYRVQTGNTEFQYKWTLTDDIHFPVVYKIKDEEVPVRENKLIQWLSNVRRL